MGRSEDGRGKNSGERMTPAIARSIPFFDYSSAFIEDEDELVRILREVGRRGAFILQEDVSRFERNLAAFLGAGHAVGVGNATDGLLIALRAAGIGRGDEVIFSSHTMVATAAAIHFSGATPVAVDCGEDHLIDPSAVAAAVTGHTRAILVTQLNGRTADMEALGEIVKRHGLVLIEDAAQALGARFQGRCAGTFGLAAAFSFYPAKTLGCLGDGGAVVTADRAVYERIFELRNHGKSRDGEIVAWGWNSRLDNLQAAILDYRLGSYGRSMERRRAIAAHYHQRLRDLEELVLPPGPNQDPRRFDVFQNYEIEAESRDALRAFLGSRGVGTLIPWGGKAVHQAVNQWDRLGVGRALARTEKLFERLLLLPLHTGLPNDDVDYITDAVRAFYRK
jgi:dTDP-4-amino-4,6-dideoxygalactose transaminase